MRLLYRSSGGPKLERPLVLRAAPTQTFRGLALFLVVVLSAAGTNLLVSNLTLPLSADAGSLLASAVSLTLAAVLLSYLLQSRRPRALSRIADRPRRARAGKTKFPVVIAGPHDLKHDLGEERSDLLFQRTYVDRAWIRR